MMTDYPWHDNHPDPTVKEYKGDPDALIQDVGKPKKPKVQRRVHRDPPYTNLTVFTDASHCHENKVAGVLFGQGLMT